VLFSCLFLTQAGLLVLSPTLPDMAREFRVSTPAAGQLRTLAGATGGLTALALALIPRRPPLRSLLTAGAALVGLGALTTAAAPTIAVLAAGQGVIGVGVGMLVAIGIAAAGSWPAPQERPRTLAWAIAGMPAAWVVGMPVTGVAAAVDWRLAWIAVPVVTSMVTLAMLRRRPADEPSRRAATRGGDRRGVARFAIGELLANAAWASVLTYCGALLIEGYGASHATVALGLAAVALAMVPGTHAGRHFTPEPTARLLIGLTLLQAAAVVALGTMRPAVGVSLAVLTLMAFINGWRSFVASSHGMNAVPDDAVAMMSVRAAANQFGYLLGAAAGGIAIAAGGFSAMGLVLGGLFVLGAVAHMPRRRRATGLAPAPARVSPGRVVRARRSRRHSRPAPARTAVHPPRRADAQLSASQKAWSPLVKVSWTPESAMRPRSWPLRREAAGHRNVRSRW
jgi:predicted MFS family arabinose efflux permease